MVDGSYQHEVDRIEGNLATEVDWEPFSQKEQHAGSSVASLGAWCKAVWQECWELPLRHFVNSSALANVTLATFSRTKRCAVTLIWTDTTHPNDINFTLYNMPSMHLYVYIQKVNTPPWSEMELISTPPSTFVHFSICRIHHQVGGTEKGLLQFLFDYPS